MQTLPHLCSSPRTPHGPQTGSFCPFTQIVGAESRQTSLQGKGGHVFWLGEHWGVSCREPDPNKLLFQACRTYQKWGYLFLSLPKKERRPEKYPLLRNSVFQNLNFALLVILWMVSWLGTECYDLKKCVVPMLMSRWDSPHEDRRSHLKFMLNCHSGWRSPLHSINTPHLQPEDENSIQTSKWISIDHRTECFLCVIKCIRLSRCVFCPWIWHLPWILKVPESTLSENLIKETLTGDGAPTAESQNHGVFHVEGELEN